MILNRFFYKLLKGKSVTVATFVWHNLSNYYARTKPYYEIEKYIQWPWTWKKSIQAKCRSLVASSNYFAAVEESPIHSRQAKWLQRLLRKEHSGLNGIRMTSALDHEPSCCGKTCDSTPRLSIRERDDSSQNRFFKTEISTATMTTSVKEGDDRSVSPLTQRPCPISRWVSFNDKCQILFFWDFITWESCSYFAGLVFHKPCRALSHTDELLIVIVYFSLHLNIQQDL